MNQEALKRVGHSFHPSSLSFISHPCALIPVPSSFFFILAFIGLSFVIACLAVAAISRHQKSGVRPLQLEGQVAQVLKTLEPEGTVLVGGELWRARTQSGVRIARGGRVRIVGARGHWLEVEAIAG